jgi:hypothetical protein
MCIYQILNVNPVACNRKYLMWRQKKYGDLQAKCRNKLKNLNGDIVEKYWPMLTVQIQKKIMSFIPVVVSPRDLFIRSLYNAKLIKRMDEDQCSSCSKYLPYYYMGGGYKCRVDSVGRREYFSVCMFCKRNFCHACVPIKFGWGPGYNKAVCSNCDRGGRFCAHEGCGWFTNDKEYCRDHQPVKFPFKF